MPFDISLPTQLHGILFTIGILDVIDIMIVAVILYRIYEMLEDTRAITLVKGLLILLTMTVVCSWLNLHVMTWLLQKTLTLLFVALPIVFQPELRRALGHLGEGHFLGKSILLNDDEARSIVDELGKATKNLSATKTGALIVIERKMKLNDVSATGIGIDAIVTSEFVQNVFVPNTPLHDGAAIIRGKRMIAAGCVLPLTDNRGLSTELGTRHRAAIGLSEQCDALVLVVSEETGTISIAEDGRIMRHLNIDTLKELLLPAFATPKMPGIKDIIMGWGKKS